MKSSPADTPASPDGSRPAPQRGTITLITGCMFAGKTGVLLSMLRDRPPSKRIAFKHVIDDRYTLDAIVSHDGDHLPATRVSSPAQMLEMVGPQISLVAIEEAHFFDRTLIDVVEALSRSGVDVVVTGLDLDTWGNPLPIVAKLRALADDPIIRHATCANCGALADRTHRLTPIIDGNLIGGSESFEPRCPRCWSPPPEPPPEYRD